MAGLGADIDGKPALAVTYDGDERILLERMAPLVDLLEISPDAIAGSDGREQHLRSEVLAELENALPHVKLIAHGVGLSIGSFDRWEERYLHLLDELFARFELQWHSEHLAYTFVAGENSGTMLPLPRSAEALDLICERVGLIQQRYGVPFLLEHVIALLPDAPAAFTPAGFLNEITSRTGCGLVLDAYNLECDAHNRGLDIPAFFAELDFAPVTELHLADGVLRNGFRLDIHTGTTRDDTLALAREIIERAPNLRAVTYEFIKQAVPFLGHDAICDELVRIRQTLLAPP